MNSGQLILGVQVVLLAADLLISGLLARSNYHGNPERGTAARLAASILVFLLAFVLVGMLCVPLVVLLEVLTWDRGAAGPALVHAAAGRMLRRG